MLVTCIFQLFLLCMNCNIVLNGNECINNTHGGIVWYLVVFNEIHVFLFSWFEGDFHIPMAVDVFLSLGVNYIVYVFISWVQLFVTICSFHYWYTILVTVTCYYGSLWLMLTWHVISMVLMVLVETILL